MAPLIEWTWPNIIAEEFKKPILWRSELSHSNNLVVRVPPPLNWFSSRPQISTYCLQLLCQGRRHCTSRQYHYEKFSFPGWGGGGAGNGSHTKMTVGSSEIFSNSTPKGTRTSFDRLRWTIFLTLRGTNFKQHKSYSVIFFRLSTLKGTMMILTVVILDLSTLNSTNLRRISPSIHIGVPPPPRIYFSIFANKSVWQAQWTGLLVSAPGGHSDLSQSASLYISPRCFFFQPDKCCLLIHLIFCLLVQQILLRHKKGVPYRYNPAC